METEVSCLRRRLAEEDIGRKKNLSAVCVVCVLSDPSGGEEWRVYAGAMVRVCMCQRRCGHGHYLKKRQQQQKGEYRRDHFWACFLTSSGSEANILITGY